MDIEKTQEIVSLRDEKELRKKANRRQNPPWHRHEEMKNNQNIPTREDMLSYCGQLEQMGRLDYSACFAMLWLTGSRIGEIVQEDKVNYVKVEIDMDDPSTYKLGKIKKNGNQTIAPIYQKVKDGKTRGLRKGDIKIDVFGGKECVVIKSNVLKNSEEWLKKHPNYRFKELPIPIEDEEDKPFLYIIDRYLDSKHIDIEQPGNEDMLIFTFNLNTFRVFLRQHDFPIQAFHIIRHARASFLDSKGLSNAEMREFFKWREGSNMPNQYSHATQRSVFNKLYKNG